MKSLIPVVALVFCASCATTYHHPEKTEAQFQKDLYECETIANQRTADKGYAGNPFIVQDEIKKCMTIKYGYTTTPGKPE